MSLKLEVTPGGLHPASSLIPTRTSPSMRFISQLPEERPWQWIFCLRNFQRRGKAPKMGRKREARQLLHGKSIFFCIILEVDNFWGISAVSSFCHPVPGSTTSRAQFQPWNPYGGGCRAGAAVKAVVHMLRFSLGHLRKAGLQVLPWSLFMSTPCQG